MIYKFLYTRNETYIQTYTTKASSFDNAIEDFVDNIGNTNMICELRIYKESND